jgi:hypothetical protein
VAKPNARVNVEAALNPMKKANVKLSVRAVA